MCPYTIAPANWIGLRVLVVTVVFLILLFATVFSQAREIVIYTQTTSTSGPTFELVADSNGTLYGLAEGGRNRSRRTWLFLLADAAGEGTKGVDRDGSLQFPGWHGRDLSHCRSLRPTGREGFSY